MSATAMKRDIFSQQLNTFTLDSDLVQRSSVHRGQGLMQAAGLSDIEFDPVQAMLLLAQPATLTLFPDLIWFELDLTWPRRTARPIYECTQLQTYSHTPLGFTFRRSFGAPHRA